jgi:hypothetical protein
MFVFFLPRLPRVVSMGNFGMSTTSTNVAQNLKLQAYNVPFEPSSRPHPSQTQLRITWRATLKQQAAKNIWRCIYKCNIPFHVTNTPTWKP